MIDVKRLSSSKRNRFNLQSIGILNRSQSSRVVQELKRSSSITVESSRANHGQATNGSKSSVGTISRQQLVDINKLVGKPIDVCFYGSGGELRIESGILVSEATEGRLYIGRDELRYCIFRWDSEDSKGTRETVAVIRDESGNVIYRNGEIPVISQLL